MMLSAGSRPPRSREDRREEKEFHHGDTEKKKTRMEDGNLFPFSILVLIFASVFAASRLRDCMGFIKERLILSRTLTESRRSRAN
jgi:hypothetical protein